MDKEENGQQELSPKEQKIRNVVEGYKERFGQGDPIGERMNTDEWTKNISGLLDGVDIPEWEEESPQTETPSSEEKLQEEEEEGALEEEEEDLESEIRALMASHKEKEKELEELKKKLQQTPTPEPPKEPHEDEEAESPEVRKAIEKLLGPIKKQIEEWESMKPTIKAMQQYVAQKQLVEAKAVIKENLQKFSGAKLGKRGDKMADQILNMLSNDYYEIAKADPMKAMRLASLEYYEANKAKFTPSEPETQKSKKPLPHTEPAQRQADVSETKTIKDIPDDELARRLSKLTSDEVKEVYRKLAPGAQI